MNDPRSELAAPEAITRFQRLSFLCWSLLGLFWLLWSPNVDAQGYLIPTQRSIAPLSIKYHRVQVNIKGRAATTTLTQVFKNHTNRVLEATYIFPLPKGANISNFILYMNGKPMKGQVLVKHRARSIYQSIVRRMQDPGLLEYMGNNLFKARVYPIPRRGEQKIKISFTQVVPYTGGLQRYVYPLKAGRRYSRTLRDFTMSINLQMPAPLKNIYSPTHRISVQRKGEKRAILGFEKDRAALNRDFVLYYSVSPKDVGSSLLSHRIDNKDGYFLLMLTPKTSYKSKEIGGKTVTFVLDTSGSMQGKKMKWAKKALLSCLKKLNAKDHFNVIRFSTDVEALFSKPKQASQASIKKALSFVKRMEAAGGTAIDEALKRALSQKLTAKGMHLVVMMTDGHPTVGVTSPRRIVLNARKRNSRRTRVFTFGIGTSINTKLLDKLAQQTGGTGDYVRPNKEIKSRINTFYDKVRYPVLSDIRLSVGSSVKLVDLYPKRIPDLFRGGQVLVLGRYRGKGDVALTLNGLVGGKRKKFVFEVRFPKKEKKNDFIAKLWANRKIAYLLDNIRLHGANNELKQEVIRLAKKFGIVTPYTSYLVVEPKDRWRLQNRRRTQTNNLLIPRRNRWARRRPRRRIRRRRWWGFGKNRGARVAKRSSSRSRRELAPSAGGNTAAPPPAAQPRVDDDLGKGGLKATSGKKAVKAAQKLRKMKDSSVLNKPSYGSRYLQGRLFLRRGGVWVDKRFKRTMKTLRIKYMSNLYFALLKKRPKLAKFLALGREVIVVIKGNKAIVITAKNTSTSSNQLNSFLR